jgi:NADH-quinone oxidoreductase subunit E
MLNGSNELAEHVKKKLGCDFNETSADGKFTLKEVECLGACVAAPVCMIDKTFYENVTPEKVDQMLAEVGE